MNRRQLVGMISAAPLLAAAPARTAERGAAPLPLEEAAAEAWIYGLMLIENANSRSVALSRGFRPNQLIHVHDLITPRTQIVTTPNNDTLYSRVWIDLDGGPVRIHMPAAGDRYVSFAFMDMYGTNFAVLGSRTTGPGAHTVTLVGPRHATTERQALRAPTPWVWLLIRVLTDGGADLAAANALQRAIRVDAPSRPMPPRYATRHSDWADYFTSVQALLMENPPPATDLAVFHRVTALGLGPNGGFDPGRFSARDRSRIEAGVAAGRRQLAAGARQGQAVDGWIYPKANLGDFRQDYLYRAQVAVGGLAALTVDEAMYMRPVGADGRTVMATDRPLRLRFERSTLPPVDAFWSLTAYKATEDGQFFLFDNPIDRYSIGDRTPGLRRGPDGSLDIWISRSDPGGERTANWLPAPDERLSLSFRTYLPRRELIDGSYRLPPLRFA